MSTTKHTTIEQLKKLALRTKSEIGLVDATGQRIRTPQSLPVALFCKSSWTAVPLPELEGTIIA